MYIVCNNSFVPVPISEFQSPDFEIIFGNTGYPVMKNSVELSSPVIKKSILTNPKNFKASIIPKDIASDITRYFYGKQFLLTIPKLQQTKFIALELGLSDILEKCYILEQSDRKIKGCILELQKGNTISVDLCKFCARYFHVFTLYAQFLAVQPSALLSIFKNSSILGINSELTLLTWLLKYYDLKKLKDQDLKDFYNLLSFVQYDIIAHKEKVALLKMHQDLGKYMVSRKEKLHFRILIDKTGTESFTKVLTSLINAKI